LQFRNTHKYVKDAVDSLTKSIKMKKLSTIATLLLIIGIAIFGTYGYTSSSEPILSLSELNHLPTNNCRRVILNPTFTSIHIGTTMGVSEHIEFQNGQSITVETLNSSVYGAANPFVLDMAYCEDKALIYTLTSDNWGGLYEVLTVFALESSLVSNFVNITGNLPDPSRGFTNLAVCSDINMVILGGMNDTLVLYDYVNGTVFLSERCQMIVETNDMYYSGYNLFIATDKGIVVYNLTTFSFTEYPMYVNERYLSINYIEFDYEANVMYLATDFGAYVYNWSNNEFTFAFHISEADGIPNGKVNCLLIDHTTNRLYIGTDSGIAVFSCSKETLIRNLAPVSQWSKQKVKHMAMRKIGQYHRLYVVGEVEGVAFYELNEIPDFANFISHNVATILTILGLELSILLTYYGQKKGKIALSTIFIFWISVVLTVLIIWVLQINTILAIPHAEIDLTIG